jgi:hypothetical protein
MLVVASTTAPPKTKPALRISSKRRNSAVLAVDTKFIKRSVNSSLKGFDHEMEN